MSEITDLSKPSLPILVSDSYQIFFVPQSYGQLDKFQSITSKYFCSLKQSCNLLFDQTSDHVPLYPRNGFMIAITKGIMLQQVKSDTHKVYYLLFHSCFCCLTTRTNRFITKLSVCNFCSFIVQS